MADRRNRLAAGGAAPVRPHPASPTPRLVPARDGRSVVNDRWRLFIALTPVLVALGIYLPALRNGFIWDDPTVLVQMRAIHGLGDLVILPPIIPRFYYRPFIFV